MPDVLFTNVRIIDATGAQPYTGEVLVQGNRIRRSPRTTRTLPTAGAIVIDGAGATLMPGMCEAHTHFGWTNSKTLDAIQKLPHEEHTLWAAQVAKQYLDYGWTSCVGAATPKPRLDLRDPRCDQLGPDPGAALPRGEPGDHRQRLARRRPDAAPAVPGNVVRLHRQRPDEMLKAVRMFLKYGVDSVKLNLSGDNLVPGADAKTTWMSDEEGRRRRARDQGAWQAPFVSRALVRIGQAGDAPRLRHHLPRELRG
jgi:imidazolonepropionase-like amidohydrolase